jgi:hypothetical protein
MPFLCFLLACTSSSEPIAPEPADTGPTTASAWEYAAEDATFVVDVGVMQRELQTLVNELRGYNATPVLDAWGGVRAYGDELCPAETVTESAENGTSTYFERLCIANERTYFKGPMTVWDFTDNDLLAFEVVDVAENVRLDGTLYSGRAMKGQTDVYELASDLDYNCSCTAVVGASDAVDEKQWWTYTDGPTHWTGPEDDGTWMEEGHQSNVYQHYRRSPDEGEWSVVIEGAVTGHAEVYGSVSLMLSYSGSLDDLATCPNTSSVEAVVRDTATGQSTTLTFGMDPSKPCFGCATVVEDQSPVCIDFSVINDWEDSPW